MKFKIGDRVRVTEKGKNGTTEGAVDTFHEKYGEDAILYGTVIEFYGEDLFYVSLDVKDCGFDCDIGENINIFMEKDLEVLRES